MKVALKGFKDRLLIELGFLRNLVVYLNMRKVKTDKVNYAVPGVPMTPKEMEQMVCEAENGKFHSMHTVKQKIEVWKQKFAK